MLILLIIAIIFVTCIIGAISIAIGLGGLAAALIGLDLIVFIVMMILIFKKNFEK